MAFVQVKNKSGQPVVSIVDGADLERVLALPWHMHGGYPCHNFTVAPNKQRRMQMGRFVLEVDFDEPRQVDHINRNVLDNRRSNLRLLTCAQNQQNRRGSRSKAGARSRYRGVSWNSKQGRWQVQVGVGGGKLHYLGLFDDELEAARVAQAYRREHLPFSEEATL